MVGDGRSHGEDVLTYVLDLPWQNLSATDDIGQVWITECRGRRTSTSLLVLSPLYCGMLAHHLGTHGAQDMDADQRKTSTTLLR